jgi:hypothetical protein
VNERRKKCGNLEKALEEEDEENERSGRERRDPGSQEGRFTKVRGGEQKRKQRKKKEVLKIGRKIREDGGGKRVDARE